MEESFRQPPDVSRDTAARDESVLKFSGTEGSVSVNNTPFPASMFLDDIDATRRLMSTMPPSVKRVLEASPEASISRLSDRTSSNLVETKNTPLADQTSPTESPRPAAAPTKLPTPVKSASTDKPLLKVVSDVWGGVRRMLGLKKPDCKNGGKAVDESCKCPELFEGQFCETRVCLNGGKLTKSTVLPITYDCKCSDPQYIEGVHCEVVKCANRAPLIKFDNGTWNCDCADSYFFSGRYCEKFEASYTVAGVALLGLVLLIICCGLCRIDWCPRRRNRRGTRSSHRHSDSARNRGRDSSGRLPTNSSSRIVSGGQAQEFLLPRNPLCNRGAPYIASNQQGPPFIIRLDTIPTFNPDMIGGVEPADGKPMEPPPSYDQALSAPTAPQPPRYTETDDLQTPYRPPPAPS